MKTTLELPDDLFRQSKATAAMRGESLKDFFTEALQAHLERQPGGVRSPRGWQSVFGKASREDVESIDRIVADEIERIDPNEWM
jgi:hypothetical protein